MHTRHLVGLRMPEAWKIALGCCLALFFLFFTMPAQASARTTSDSGGPTLQASVGYGTTYKEGYWTPVYITLNNNGPAFRGTLSVSTYMGSMRTSGISYASPWQFETAVTLPGNSLQHLTEYVPFYLGNLPPRGVIVELRNTQGKVVATQITYNGYGVQQGSLFIGVLADQSSDFGPLNNVSLPNQTSTLTLAKLNASTMPTTAAALSSFDLIVLADFSSSTLNPAQLAALRTWVNQGGILVEVGGSQWERTLDALPPSLVPVAIDGTYTIDQGARLVPVTSPTNLSATIPGQGPLPTNIPTPVTASTAFIRSQDAFSAPETLQSYDMIPLLVRARQGAGAVYYLAVDPTQPPLVSWTGSQALWKSLLLDAFGENFLIPSSAPGYYGGPGQLLSRGGILTMLAPQMLLGPWIIVVILLGYVLLLGPVRLLIMRHLKRPAKWGWRITAGTILVFSLLSYGLASYQRGASLTDNSISILQFDQGGTNAHIATYMGVFVPNQGDYNVHLPRTMLTEPVPHSYLLSSKLAVPSEDLETVMTYGPDGTNIDLQDRGPWSFHPLVSEEDRQFKGGISAHIGLNNNRVQGSIRNTLNTGLSDVYLLLPHSFVRIGHINAGETQRISLPLQSLAAGESLADQLAQSGGLSTPYFPYDQNASPQSNFQQHMALLSALNGAGFSFFLCGGSCTTHAINSRGTLFVTGGRVPNPQMADTPDQLLIADGSATLIGWADNDLAGISATTINGKQRHGMHESFIEMPINLDLTTPASIPQDLVTGHVVDIQSFDAQVSLPGIYSMSSGGITFELDAPAIPDAQNGAAVIRTPDLLASQITSAPGQTANMNHLRVELYNWLTQSWDRISETGDTYTITNRAAYIDASGRILIYITPRSSNSANRVFFGKPVLLAENP